MPPDSLIGGVRLARLVELASSTPAGPFVEVGVYKGGSAWHLLRLAQQQQRKLHLFDTFTGIPYAKEIDNHKVGDFSDTSVEQVKAALPGAFFHVGLFPDTLPDDLTDIAFVHADCDQYDSVRAVIERLWPRMIKGGIMAFDDYRCTRGATKACEEHFPEMIESIRGDELGWVRV